MAKNYARGKRAWGICGRSGRKMLLKDMIFDGRYPNMRVDPSWYEARHPQETLPRVEDPIALYRPSPEVVATPTLPVVTLVVEGATQINVTWTPAETGITNIEEYVISRSVNGGPLAPLVTCVLQKDFLGGIIGITNATFPVQPELPNDPWANVPADQPATYEDTTVVFGDTYCYQVEAVPQGNNQYVAQGPPAISATVCTTVTIPPPVLTGFYDFINSAVDLAWSMPGIWGSAVQHYQIYHSVNGAPFTLLTTVTGATTTYVDSTATSFLNQYQYYVIAQLTAGNSPDSNTLTEPTVTVQLFTQSGSYIAPPGTKYVVPTAIGAGGGGTSSSTQANSGNGGSFGGYGGGGGAFARAAFAIAAVGTGAIPVIVGAGGVGGGAQTTDVIGTSFLYGLAGSAGGNSSFGSVLTAGGGAGGPVGNTPGVPAPGGTATITGGADITTETGGKGAFLYCFGVGQNLDSVAGNTTLAGAGGGSGGLPLFNVGITLPIPGGTAGSVAGGVAGVNVSYPDGTIGGSGGNGAAQTGVLGGSGGGGGGFATPPGGGEGGGIAEDFTAGAGGSGGGYGSGGGGSGMVVAYVSGLGPDHHQYAFGVAGGNGGPGVVEVAAYS